MSAFIAVASREVRERWFVFAAAAAFAILPLLIAMLPFGGSGAEKIATLSGVLSVGLTLGLGVALGASIIGRDLSSGKLSFYFARPLGVASMWFGKLAAGFILVFGAFAISFLPILFVRKAWQDTWNVELLPFATGYVGLSLLLLLISHAVSTAIRSRSWLIGVDFALLAIAAVVFLVITWPLMQSFAMISALNIGVAVILMSIVAIVPAGLWQLARGRADRFRSHSAMSTFLWGSVGVLLVVAAAWSLWIRSATPGDLTGLRNSQRASSANVIFFTGEAKNRRDYYPSFVADVSTGRYVSGGRSLPFTIGDVSADGSTVVYAQPSSAVAYFLSGLGNKRMDASGLELFVAPALGTGEAKSLGSVELISDAEISPDGRTVVVATDEKLVSVYDATSTRLLFSGRIDTPKKAIGQISFVSSRAVRYFSIVRPDNDKSGPFTIEVFDIDVASKRIQKLPSIAAWGWSARVDQLSSGDVMVRTWRRGLDGPAPADAPARVRLLDARTGAIKLAIDTPNANARIGSARVLRDGTVAVVESDDSSRILRFVRRDSTEKRVVLPKTQFARLEGELPDGRLVVYAGNYPGEQPREAIARSSALVVGRDGRITERKGLVPVTSSWWVAEARYPQPIVPCVDAKSRFYRWNVANNTVEPIVWKKG